MSNYYMKNSNILLKVPQKNVQVITAMIPINFLKLLTGEIGGHGRWDHPDSNCTISL